MFGASPNPGGFTFGQQATSVTTQNATFSIGGQTQTTAPSGGFTFNTPATSATMSSAGFSFGGGLATQPPQTTQPPPYGATSTASTSQTPGFTGFALGKMPTVTTGGTAPATTFDLKAPTAAGLKIGGGTTATAGFSFPNQTTTPASQTQGFQLGSTATTTGTGLTLGTTQGSTSGLTLGTTTTATNTAGFQLGAAKPTGALGSLTTTSQGSALGSLLSTTQTPTLGSLAAKTTTLGGFNVTSTTAATSTATTTTSIGLTATVAPGEQMTYQQLEENINKWMADLEKQEQDFLQQATQVNAWDRLLVENGEKITTLNSEMERVNVDQQKLDHELDFIRAQQRELEDLLEPLEKAVEQQPNINYQQHSALERENTYQLAENIDAQLKRMLQDLKEIIDHLNTSNANQDQNDPIQQITKILNSHMDSLQWVDQNSAFLGRRVEEIAKQMEIQRKEQERNFRLVYN